MFRARFLFRHADPPPLGAGGVLGIFATPTVAQGSMIYFLLFGGTISPRPPRCGGGAIWYFAFPSTRFCPAPHLPGDMAVFFIDVFLRYG